jgi:hypothetical protein
MYFSLAESRCIDDIPAGPKGGRKDVEPNRIDHLPSALP